MGSKSSRGRSRKNESGEVENEPSALASSSPTAERGSATMGATRSVSRVSGNARKPESGAPIQRSATADRVPDQHEASGSDRGYVAYDPGPDREALGDRSGIDVRPSQATKLQRLEKELGTDRVSRWAEEGMTVETMGKPRDMRAFRKRQAGRPAEVPTDVERRNEASVQRNAKRTQDDGPAGDAGVPDVVRSVVSSPGRSMDGTVQREMESRMGGDFDDVRVHTGPQAAAAAEAIDARAFAVGTHVAFNRGEYRPGSADGKRVLAHELTHVRQQTGGQVSMLPKADAAKPASGPRTGATAHVQPRLEVSSPDDPAEREAESVAEQVMQMSPVAPAVDPEGAGRIDRTGSADGSAVGGGARRQIGSLKGGGKPLSSSTRSFFEPRFGRDFGDVRVHTGPAADRAARSINAEAFTHGTDVVFRSGAYDPEGDDGKRLLAHELTHVAQEAVRPGDSSLSSRERDPDAPVPRIHRVVELRPPGSGEASAYDRRQELVDRLNDISDGMEYRLQNAGQGAQLHYDVQNRDELTNFDTQMRGFIDQPDVVPMRLITSAGQVQTPGGYSPVFVDAAVSGYVDLDDLLAGDDQSFQMNLIHILTERLQIEDYERRIGTPMPEFDAAHRAGLEAEAEYLRSVIGDPTIEYLYTEEKGSGTVVFGFESDEGYRVFHVFGESGELQRGGNLFVRTADGNRMSVDEFVAQREQGQEQAGAVEQTATNIVSMVKVREMLSVLPVDASLHQF